MRRIILSIFVYFSLAIISNAQETTNKPKGVDKASKDGFVVISLITDDKNWQEKWNSPTPPKFSGVEKIGIDEPIIILTFFSNASAPKGEILLNCDIKYTKPNGEAKQYPPQLCYQSKVEHKPNRLYVTGFDVKFAFSADSEPGWHFFEVGVTDVNRQLRVPVNVGIEFDKGNTGEK